MSPIISVVIATHNRADYLHQALEGLKEQSLRKEVYEVIVVDNASTDHTAAVVRDARAEPFKLRYIFEKEPSANKARNIGWQHALGEYVVYMDDDAVPVPEWLERIVDSFEKINPKPGIVGGRVIPLWESPKPGWIHDRMLGALSLIDYAPKATFLDKKLPFSVNMAFRKELLTTFGGFDLALGRKGKKLLSGDETAVAIRIRRAGHPVYYDPAITVHHHIPTGRLTQEWFAKRYYWGGYSEALMWKLLDKPSFRIWFRKFAFYVYGFLRNPCHILHLAKDYDTPEKFWLKCTVYGRLGYLVGLFAAPKQ